MKRTYLKSELRTLLGFPQEDRVSEVLNLVDEEIDNFIDCYHSELEDKLEKLAREYHKNHSHPYHFSWDWKHCHSICGDIADLLK